MDDTIIDLLKKMYEEMQENNEQIIVRLEVMENTIAEIKALLSENFKSIEKDLESIQDTLIEIKYR